jgi:hypothetical protein
MRRLLSNTETLQVYEKKRFLCAAIPLPHTPQWVLVQLSYKVLCNPFKQESGGLA